MKDLGDALFAVLIDESRDVSSKEQMVVVLRYVDKKGCVVERFLGIKHVSSTTARSLKTALGELLGRHGLSMSRLRGQGYDGASYMQGEYNGLKTLILKEHPYAFYIHCFAHQLQLALVGVAKNHLKIGEFFNTVSTVVNVVGASCKRRDILLEKQAEKVKEAINNGELQTGKGLNQETTIKRAGDTRWGSHYNSLLNLIGMFSSVVDVLEMVKNDGLDLKAKIEASTAFDSIQTFEFAFNLHLMRRVLGITNDLSQALQKKDQNIVNAMSLVTVSKQRIQMMRDFEWDSLLDEVSSFCAKHEIHVPVMNDLYRLPGRSRRGVKGLTNVTNLHHYQADCFNAVIDRQLRELNDRFNEANTKLLLDLAALNPCNSFHAFDKEKLIRLAKLYPEDFSTAELLALSDQLENYIVDVRSNDEFLDLKGICDLSKKMVETGRDEDYKLVYRLLTLALILPVATATVERVFSAMKIVKSELRNRMGDEWTSNCLIVYIEDEFFCSVDNEAIIQHYQTMSKRRGQL